MGFGVYAMVIAITLSGALCRDKKKKGSSQRLVPF